MESSYHYVLIEQPFRDLGDFVSDTVAIELKNLDVVFADSTNVSPEGHVRGGPKAPLATIGGLGCWLPPWSPLGGESGGGLGAPLATGGRVGCWAGVGVG